MNISDDLKASAYFARGYAKLVLDGDVQGLLADLLQGFVVLGVKVSVPELLTHLIKLGDLPPATVAKALADAN